MVRLLRTLVDPTLECASLRAVFLLALLALVLIVPLRPFGSVGILPNVSGFLGIPNPSMTLQANFQGWNFSQPSGTNPTIASSFLFPGQNLTATGVVVDGFTHSLAYYQPGTNSSQVTSANHCGSPGDLCLARVFLNLVTPVATLKFAFPSASTFELYCEFHPLAMHSKVFVNRTPDINSDHVVNIIDLVMVAIAFGSNPTTINWNPNADLNRDNMVNILDLVAVAVNFGRTV